MALKLWSRFLRRYKKLCRQMMQRKKGSAQIGQEVFITWPQNNVVNQAGVVKNDDSKQTDKGNGKEEHDKVTVDATSMYSSDYCPKDHPAFPYLWEEAPGIPPQCHNTYLYSSEYCPMDQPAIPYLWEEAPGIRRHSHVLPSRETTSASLSSLHQEQSATSATSTISLHQDQSATSGRPTTDLSNVLESAQPQNTQIPQGRRNWRTFQNMGYLYPGKNVTFRNQAVLPKD